MLKRGKNIEEVIIESIAEKLDPKTRVRIYVKLHEKYLHEAKNYIKGDFVQSSEKYWRVLTLLLNIVGEKRTCHITRTEI